MKLRFLILNIALGIGLQTYSQAVFNRIYNNASYFFERLDGYAFNNNDDFETIEILNSDYSIHWGGSNKIPLLGDTTTFEHFIYYVKVENETGNKIWEKELNLYSGTDFVTDVYSYSDQSFFIFGSADTLANPSNSNGVGTMIRLDNQGDYIKHYDFRFGDRTQFWGVKTQDNGLTFDIIGRVDTGGVVYNYVGFVVKIDSSGNILNQFYGMDYGQLEFFYDLEYGVDSSIYVNGVVPGVAGNNDDYYFIKLDKNYNLLWEKRYPDNLSETMGPEESLIIEEDGLVFCGWSLTNNDDIKARVSKIDFQGNFIWEYASEEKSVFNGYKVIRKTNDEHYVVAGGTGDPNIINNHRSRALLSKVSNTGELIWTRIISKYWEEFSYDYLYDLAITPDGGFLLAGYQINSQIQTNGIFNRNDAWLVKTDSCGFTTGAQPQALLTVDSVVGATVYITNLSEEYCIASLDISSFDFTSFDSLDIYAYSDYTNGEDPTQIQYTFTDTGTYNLTLYTYAGDGVDTFTTQAVIKNTTTSIENINSQLAVLDLNVFPNPAKDYFILQADIGMLNQVQHDGFNKLIGEIYTTTGQKIQEFNINPKLLQQRIYLNDLSNGVYVLKVSVGNRVVGVERISVVK